MVIIVICLLMKKKSVKLKQMIKMSTFQINFALKAYLINVEAEEVSLKRSVYDFSLDYDAIDKFDILHFHKYLMVMNNIKQCSGLLNKCLLHYCVLVNLY